MIDSLDLCTTWDLAMPSMTPSPSPTNGSSLRQGSTEVLSALRIALRLAIGYSAGVGQKSRDVQTRFGVNFQLSWEIYCIVADGNVLNTASNVPTPAEMKRLYPALRKKDVTEDLVTAVESAYDAYLTHIAETAGDRAMFDAIITRMVGGEAASQKELVHREAAFEAQRYIMGCEQGLHLVTHMLHPMPETPTRVHSVNLIKRCRLTRLNLDIPFTVDRSPKGTIERDLISRPLDPVAAEKYGFPLMQAFCSHPELPLRRRSDDLATFVEWGADDLGVRGAVDIAIGRVTSNVPLDYLDGYYGVECRMNITIAVRRIVFDFFVHRPTYGQLIPEAARFARVSQFPADHVRMSQTSFPQLPCYEQIEFMGGGASAAHLSGVPDYIQMLEYACSEMKWKLQEFDLYRMTVDYPYMDTCLVRSFPFPRPLAADLTQSP